MIAAAVMFFACADTSYAETLPHTDYGKFTAPATSVPKAEVSANCQTYVGLTNHIAGCIRDTLDVATDKFFAQFYPMVSRSIAAAMTIAIALFGMMAAMGLLEKAGRDAIMLLLKIAMVGYFSMNSDVMYKTVISLMDSTGQSVVGYVPSTGTADTTGKDFSQITCLNTMRETQAAEDPSKPMTGPWIAMDCMIDSVIGIKVDPKRALGTTTVGVDPTDKIIVDAKGAYNDMLNGKNTGLSRGLLYLFFASYQTSVMGLILAVIGLIFLWGMVSLIIKSLFIYIAGYLGIAVMMIISPIFIPMVLFQATKSYFDKWVKLVISFALQPIIMLVFITFSIAAVDLAIFSGDYSVMYRIAGDASRQRGFSLNEYLTTPRPSFPATNPATTSPAIKDVQIKLAQVKGDNYKPMGSEKAIEGIVRMVNSPCTETNMINNPALKVKCENGYPIMVDAKSLDWDQLASVRTPAVELTGDAENLGQQLSREVLAATFFAGIVVFVMNQLLKVIPSVAYDLLGDFGQSPNIGAVGGVVPGGQKMRSAMESMVSSRKAGAS